MPETPPAAQDYPSPPSWRWGPADTALSAGLLALVVAGCLPLAWHLHGEARAVDQERTDSLNRVRGLNVTLKYVQARRTALGRLRRAVDRYVADVEARPVVPWTTVVTELSAQRPAGLWATRLSGEGPRFSAEVAAERPELVTLYAERLRQSRYVEFAALPPGAPPRSRGRVVGRMMGE